MKRLVTEYHALNIKTLARGGYLYSFSRFEWVWRTKGIQAATVSITMLKDSLHIMFPFGNDRVLQAVKLTYSFGPRGGKLSWFQCPTCRRRVGVLYHQSRMPFRCRICCALAYPSQYRSHGHSYGRHHRCLGDQGKERLI